MNGHSLIEVLVALLVIATGVLGAVALQVASLQGNRAALDRTVASHAAWSMVDRIRANPDAGYDAALDEAPPGSRNCTAAPCTPADLAAFDTAAWKCSLGRWQDETACEDLTAIGFVPPPGGRLPSGDGAIVTDAGRVTVTVRWRRAGGEAALTVATRP